MKKKISMLLTLPMMLSMSIQAHAVSYDTTYNGHGYKIFNNGMTWQQAKQFCEQQGGHLVTINSSQEQSLVVGLLRSKGNKNSYWLGGYKSGNSWMWITGESFSYKNWGQWQPDGDGSALMMYRSTGNGWPLGVWNDIADNGGSGPFFGSNNFGFICEWEENKENIKGDVNGDGRIDRKDYDMLLNIYLRNPGYPNYLSSGDLNNDGKISIIDLGLLKEKITPVGHDPQGNFENYGTGINVLRVVGWALDEDNLNQAVQVKVYIDGQYGQNQYKNYTITANKVTNDHQRHGFDETVQVDDYWCGWKTIRAYAVGIGSGAEYKEIGVKIVFIPYKKKAPRRIIAYTNANLTQKNKNEWVDAGDTCIILDENVSANSYYVRYPVRNGTKDRWVSRDGFK